MTLRRTLLTLVLLMATTGCDDSPREVVDRALRANGDLGVYGDLSAGLEALEADTVITLTDKGEYIAVDLAPKSGEGHDMQFRVVKATGELTEVVVGTVEDEPEPETP